MTFLHRFEPQLFAILRIVAGVLFATHGSQKLLGVPPMPGAMRTLPPLLIAAGVIELVGGVLLVIGLFTEWVAFITAGEMAVAYLTSHAPHGPIPLANRGELAVLYCFLYLFIAAHGGGIWSADAALRRKPAG